MNESDDPILEAVSALRSRGHTVEADENFELWQVDRGEWIPLGGLLALAVRLGLMDSPSRLQ